MVLKAIKVLMYGFLFIMVLGTAVMAKFSFIVLTTNTGINKLKVDFEKVRLKCSVLKLIVERLWLGFYNIQVYKMYFVFGSVVNK